MFYRFIWYKIITESVFKEDGLISDKRVQVGKRMTRIYYHLEEAGAQRLDELIREYRETTQAVYRIANIEGGIDNETI